MDAPELLRNALYILICLSFNFFDLLRHSWKQSTILWLQAGQWPPKSSKGGRRSYLAVRELPESRLNEESVLHELRLLLYYLIKAQGSVCTLECSYKNAVSRQDLLEGEAKHHVLHHQEVSSLSHDGWEPSPPLHPSAAYLLCLQTSLYSAAALNGVPITLKGAVCSSVTSFEVPSLQKAAMSLN